MANDLRTQLPDDGDPVDRGAARVPDADPDLGSLGDVAPGGALATQLETLDPTAVSDSDLLEIVAATRRLTAWVHSVATRHAAELAGRASMNPLWDPAAGPPPARACVAGDELAMRLSCSRRHANRLVDHGRAFARELTATGEALATGTITAVAADQIAERLAGMPVEVTAAVQQLVLPEAPARTPAQLTRDLERALLLVDPDEAAARVERARSGRCVHRPRPLPDGMAGLTAVLPAVEAVRIDATLEAAARAARAGGDPRTLDQLRADGLVDLLLHTACTTTGPAGPAGPGDGTTAGDATPPGAGTAVPHHRTEVRITVPLSTAIGVDDHPAELDGYGSVDATTARALAAGGTWRRIITDPKSGTVLDVGRTTYRPPAPLARHVRTRDTVCARPGCSTPAESCDLDHTIAYHDPPDGHPPGVTADHNLGPLCRRDHRLKTDGGFTLQQVEPGKFVWTTPTGDQYLTVPGTPCVPGYHRRLGPAERAADPDAPPF
jgi:hypothetical protein